MKNQSDPEGVLIRLFGSVSRARILTLLISRAGQRLYQREIMYEIGFPLQPVQRELQNLLDLGIVKNVSTLNRVYYEINTSSPFFKPLREICGFTIKQKFQIKSPASSELSRGPRILGRRRRRGKGKLNDPPQPKLKQSYGW